MAAGACVRLPSTLWFAAPVLGSPLFVRTAATPVAVLVTSAPPTVFTVWALAVESVCTHTPSGSLSHLATLCSNRSVSLPTMPLSLSTLRLLARFVSSAPRSRRSRTLLLPPETVTASLKRTSTTIRSPRT